MIRIALFIMFLIGMNMALFAQEAVGNARLKKISANTWRVTWMPNATKWSGVVFPLSDNKPNNKHILWKIKLIEPVENKKIGKNLLVTGHPHQTQCIKSKAIGTKLISNQYVPITFLVTKPSAVQGIRLTMRSVSQKTVLEITSPTFCNTVNKKQVLSPLPPIKFKGKPFFPNGAYDTFKVGQAGKFGSIDPDFVAAGGNITDFAGIGMQGWQYYESHNQPALFKGLEKVKNDPLFTNIALIVKLEWNLIMDSSKAGNKWGMHAYTIPAKGKAKERHIETLTKALKKLKNYPNVIGYTYDEPDNQFWVYYNKNFKKEWELTKDTGMANMMLKDMGWIAETVHKIQPEALMMPIIGWWTNYKALSPLYDVLIANTYPRSDSKKEFSAPLYNVSYDAYLAVNAAREAGKGKTVIFMPPMFDSLKNFPVFTIAEQRYVCFAPVTRGVMGIHGWRLQRCSNQHRKNVIYPVMKDIRNLSEFFLGSWHDELVTSDNDKPTFAYLKKFKSRIRLVEGKEDGKMLTDESAVPNVSYCLRKHKDGRYLLLAVNNSRAELTVNFKLQLNSKPLVLTDYFDNHKVKTNIDGKFSDKFSPFAVHAYIFTSKE